MELSCNTGPTPHELIIPFTGAPACCMTCTSRASCRRVPFKSDFQWIQLRLSAVNNMYSLPDWVIWTEEGKAKVDRPGCMSVSWPTSLTNLKGPLLFLPIMIHSIQGSLLHLLDTPVTIF